MLANQVKTENHYSRIALVGSDSNSTSPGTATSGESFTISIPTRIIDRPKSRIHRVGTHAEFIEICFPCHQGSGILQLLDYRGVERTGELI